MAYLYLTVVFEWDPREFSIYKTFQSSFQVLAMLIGIPIMSKLLHWSDTVIMMVGAVAHTVARIVFALAPEAWYFFIGKFFNVEYLLSKALLQIECTNITHKRHVTKLREQIAKVSESSFNTSDVETHDFLRKLPFCRKIFL